MYNIIIKLNSITNSNQPEVRLQRRYQKTLFTENKLKKDNNIKKDNNTKNIYCYNKIKQYLKKNRSENRLYILYRKKLFIRDLILKIVISQKITYRLYS
jgi:hypothetical protein